MKRLASVLMILGLVLGLTSGFANPQPAAAADMGRFTMSTVPVVLAETDAEAERRNAVERKLQNKFGEKIDLNNSNVRVFARYPGMYPTLAGKILRATKNEPFSSIDDVFNMPGLTDREISILERYEDRFVVTPPETAIVEGGDRFNNGIYADVK